jgi:hypothetical protein
VRRSITGDGAVHSSIGISNRSKDGNASDGLVETTDRRHRLHSGRGSFISRAVNLSPGNMSPRRGPRQCAVASGSGSRPPSDRRDAEGSRLGYVGGPPNIGEAEGEGQLRRHNSASLSGLGTKSSFSRGKRHAAQSANTRTMNLRPSRDRTVLPTSPKHAGPSDLGARLRRKGLPPLAEHRIGGSKSPRT